MIVGAGAAIGLLFLIESINKQKKEVYGGAYIFLILGFVVVGIVQIGVIQYTIKAAGQFDIFFVNSLSMPFFSGFAFFFIFIAALTWYALRFANKKNWEYLRLCIWCFAFLLIGYSSYLTTMIRSNADPSVDMYNVDNPMSLVGYLGREQYGDFPILYGQNFNANPVYGADGRVAFTEGSMKYQKTKDKYLPIGKKHQLYI
jgi:hypothetical protein